MEFDNSDPAPGNPRLNAGRLELGQLLRLFMTYLEIKTDIGDITLEMRPDVAPATCSYITRIVKDRLYDGCCFYRSDFVIQMGLSTPDRKKVKNPYPRIEKNESKLPNIRGAASIAHWDCVSACGTGCTKHAPDCGGSEFFINLKANKHLDTTWGGYCSFATVLDAKSMQVVDKIAAEIKGAKNRVKIQQVRLVERGS